MARDWSLEGWDTGRRLTLAESFGFSRKVFRFPQLAPRLPQASARYPKPIEVQAVRQGLSGGKAPVQQRGPLRQYARKLLREHGWGDQWTSFDNLVNSESGWNPQIKESTSIGGQPPTYAYGIAQALDHGKGTATQGTQSDMYGGYGLTDKQAKAANSGDGYWQLAWMMNYIESVYGSPDKAWAFHQQNNSY